jgi:hypothetical protein
MKPQLTNRLKEENSTLMGLIYNAKECIKSGITLDEWIKFMKDEYDLTKELEEYVKLKLKIVD